MKAGQSPSFPRAATGICSRLHRRLDACGEVPAWTDHEAREWWTSQADRFAGSSPDSPVSPAGTSFIPRRDPGLAIPG